MHPAASGCARGRQDANAASVHAAGHAEAADRVAGEDASQEQRTEYADAERERAGQDRGVRAHPRRG